jgi:hypothetical protein
MTSRAPFLGIQWLEHGILHCRAYDGVAVDRNAFIVIVGAGSPASEQNARELVDELEQAILGLTPKAERVGDTTHQSTNPTECGLFGIEQAQRLLVVVGDDKTNLSAPSFHANWSQYLDVGILPVLPHSARPNASKLIQQPLKEENAVFWSVSLKDAVPAILACSAATLEVPRVFISYRQNESAALAVQLFDALSHKGFDVFLDYYRIPPGVNFQKRLTQELGDKSMVVVLESNDILGSEWTRYEVTTAKSCELSLFALALPGGTEIPDIPDHQRMQIVDTDFVGGAFSKTAELTPQKLDESVLRIRTAHDAGVIARRGATREQLQRNLLLHSVNDQQVDPSTGALNVRVSTAQHGTMEFVIWASVRSPDLSDFHVAHRAAVAPARGIVVALARLMEARTASRIQWLSDVCSIRLFDRGQIETLTQQIADGSLS